MAIRDMVARHSNYDETQDMVPTPPYATRVLYELVAPQLKATAPQLRAWEPSAGFGHMSATMKEYGHPEVYASDKTVYENPYKGEVVHQFDFLNFTGRDADLIAMNPPYKHLGEFIDKGLERTTRYLAVLARIQCLEGQNRYNDLYSRTPPTKVAVFSNRIPFKTGVVVKKAPKMFLHVWLFWDTTVTRNPGQFNGVWLPPDVQQKYEKDSDYGS